MVDIMHTDRWREEGFMAGNHPTARYERIQMYITLYIGCIIMYITSGGCSLRISSGPLSVAKTQANHSSMLSHVTKANQSEKSIVVT